MGDWPKRIKVDKRIVNLLSESTYTDFYQTIREFVNNSYDADATRVDINVDSKYRFIEIIDNGHGMMPDDFEGNFLTLAYTAKSGIKKTRLGRETIGRFGVGYLSATPFCDQLFVESTTRGNEQIFKAYIDCKRFRKTKEEISFLEEIPVKGEDYIDKNIKNKQFTIIRLEKLTPKAKSFFEKEVLTSKRSSITHEDPEGKLAWYLQQILPIEYPEWAEEFRELFHYEGRIPMEVFLNDKKLYRNVPEGEIILSSGKEIVEIGNIKVKYAIGTPWETVKPIEMRGLQVRIKDVGIGLPHYFGVNWLTGHMYARLRWIYGEIHILQGLEQELSIHRNGFNESEDYSQFYEAFMNNIIKVCNILEKDQRIEKKIDYIADDLEELIDEIEENKEEEKIAIKGKISPSIRVITEPITTISSKLENIVDNAKKYYKVERKPYLKNTKQKPIKVNIENKKITIVENHPDLQEKILIGKNVFNVKYDKWVSGERSDDYCIIKIKKRELILNENFILFHNEEFSDFLKRCFAILAFFKVKYSKQKEMFDEIEKLFVKTFMIKRGRDEYDN